MKYQHLVQISSFLSGFNQIKRAKRVDERVILLEFAQGKNTCALCFDLSKNNSSIYAHDGGFLKNYKAPFDTALSLYFSAAQIMSISVMENNRVLKIKTLLQKSYKSVISTLVFEFTGRNTNAVILDEDDLIINSLSHIEKSSRKVMISLKYEDLESFDIKEKKVDEIIDFPEFFAAEFLKVNAASMDQKRRHKLSLLDKKAKALEEKLKDLAKEDELEKEATILQARASTLLAHLHELKDYEREFRLNDFNYKLKSTPKQECNQLFKQAKKLKQKAKNLKIERENLGEKLSAIKSMSELILNTHDASLLDSIMPPKSRDKKRKENIQFNIENFYINEYKISVGLNEKANAALLKSAKKNDLWFHLQNIPGAHVLISSNKQNIPEELLRFAAKTCAIYSKVKSGSFLVDFTKRGNLHLQEGAKVTYNQYSSMKVEI